MEWAILVFVIWYYGFKAHKVLKQYMIPIPPRVVWQPGSPWAGDVNGLIVRFPTKKPKRKEKHDIDWRKEGF